MRRQHTYDQDWERLAQAEPMWAVLTDERYRSIRLTPESEKAFWQSGEAYVRHVGNLCTTHFGRPLAPHRALDFGCGVGRLLVPLARLSGEAVGVDASPTMLAHARSACDRAGLSNVSFLPSLPTQGAFDLVNSALVLQHIPVPSGLFLLDRLLACLAPGGLLAIQVLFSRPGNRPLRRAGRWLYANLRPLRWLANRWLGTAGNAPYMQMNAYPLDLVFRKLYASSVSDLHVILTSQNDFASALIVGAKHDRAAQTGPT